MRYWGLTGMSDRLMDLILSLTPADGASIGNGAMMALLREHQPDLSDEAYAEAVMSWWPPVCWVGGVDAVAPSTG